MTNPADRGGGLPAGLPLQQASGGHLEYTVRQGGGECHCHARALYAGGCRGQRPAGGGGAGVQYLDHAVKAQANLGADGIRLSIPLK
jgi:hypothetical protein